jgi:hypothetical protein
LTPTTTKALLDAGYRVHIERSPERIFDDSEFQVVGATLVPENTWREAPADHIIVGLKELPEEDCESSRTALSSKSKLLICLQFLSSTYTSSLPIATRTREDGNPYFHAFPEEAEPC